MKKAISFKGGVRGKYAAKKITILGARTISDDTEIVRPANHPSLIVKIDEDVAAIFKTPEAVNQALRGLIQIMTVANH
jgi:hypothetical protein